MRKKYLVICEEECGTCNGTGEIVNRRGVKQGECPVCNGKGKTREEVDLEDALEDIKGYSD